MNSKQRAELMMTATEKVISEMNPERKQRILELIGKIQAAVQGSDMKDRFFALGYVATACFLKKKETDIKGLVIDKGKR